MKPQFRLLTVLILCFATTFLACGEKKNNNKSLLSLFLGRGFSAGDKGTYTADGVSFAMVYVPGGKTFPKDIDDSGTAAVANAYWIGETEVTYELWKKVYDWATDAVRGANIYTFANPGIMGDGIGDTPQHPVTMVNWRDAMVWCNALTEWYTARKGTSYECVYTYSSIVIRDSRDSNATACDGTVAGLTANGFRLLSSNEWELAARWRNDATNTVSGFSDPWFTKGNSASGATTYYNNNTSGSGEPGKSANDAVAVYGYYWDGSYKATGVTGTAPVKTKDANSLGLYDMSGNVWEWGFDLSGSNRVLRGGQWYFNASWLTVGIEMNTSPNDAGDYVGFRLARAE